MWSDSKEQERVLDLLAKAEFEHRPDIFASLRVDVTRHSEQYLADLKAGNLPDARNFVGQACYDTVLALECEAAAKELAALRTIRGDFVGVCNREGAAYDYLDKLTDPWTEFVLACRRFREDHEQHNGRATSAFSKLHFEKYPQLTEYDFASVVFAQEEAEDDAQYLIQHARPYSTLILAERKKFEMALLINDLARRSPSQIGMSLARINVRNDLASKLADRQDSA